MKLRTLWNLIICSVLFKITLFLALGGTLDIKMLIKLKIKTLSQ